MPLKASVPLAVALLAACAPAPSQEPAWSRPDPATWLALGQELGALRSSRPVAPWAAAVRVEVTLPRTGRTVEGRGAIAASPGRAVRTILVGGPGATILDAWVTPDAWRIAVPPAGLLRRGRGEAPADLPVGFLRWWFLSPLDGALVEARRDAAGAAWRVRAGAAVVELTASSRDGGQRLVATRRSAGRSERVEEDASAPGGPSPGDVADYDDLATGLRVHVVVESRSPAPDPAAFADPESPEGGS